MAKYKTGAAETDGRVGRFRRDADRRDVLFAVHARGAGEHFGTLCDAFSHSNICSRRPGDVLFVGLRKSDTI